MSKKKALMGVLLIVLGITLIGCASLFGGGGGHGRAPASFVRGAGGETTILLRPDLDFDQAFREVVFILNRHDFNPEMMQPEAGFIRTGWNNHWVSMPGRDGLARYRVRVIAQFNPARTQLIINPEGEWLENGVWIRGFDTRAVETLRNDLTVVLGN